MRDSDWQIIYELFQTLNMTKAANHLFMSQPALSKRIQLMEAEFQVKIVERTAKGLVFTKAGKILARNSEEYMNLSKRTQRQLRRLKETEYTVITLGIPYSYSKNVLTDILFPYTQQDSSVRFEIVNDVSNRLFAKACDGDVDVAFVRGDYESDDVEQYMIEESCAYILTRDRVEIEDLPQMARLTYLSNDRSRALIQEWWFEYFREPIPDGFSTGNYLDVAWQLAAKGMGYVCCFLPDGFENTYNLVMTPMVHKDSTPVKRKSWLVHGDKGGMSPALRKFVQYIKNTIVLK